jgi:tRNA U34 2-thiouridine synthase MnmA/TrmU
LNINKKAYVVATDIKKNTVTVSYNKEEPELIKKEISVEGWHWIGDEYPLPLECSTKIRYRQEPNSATMKTIGEKITFSYTDKQRGIAQ